MSVKNSIRPIELTSFNTTGLSTAFKVINTNGLDESCFLIRIINESNKDVTVSYDGATSHDYVPIGETVEIRGLLYSNDRAEFPKGLKIYIKGIGAGTGLVYLSGYNRPQGI